MIVCKDYKFQYKDTTSDKDVVYVELYTNSTPSPLPTNAEDLIGFPKNFVPTNVQFGAGSYLYIVSSGDVYIADENGTFILQ
jgi:hypothetical protein